MIFVPKRDLVEKVVFLCRPIHRHNEGHMRLLAHQTVPVPATRAAQRNKQNSPTVIPSTASTYAFPTNYRFIVRFFSLLCELVLSTCRVDRCACVGSSYAVAKPSSCKMVQKQVVLFSRYFFILIYDYFLIYMYDKILYFYI